jgi:hypothetical protein
LLVLLCALRCKLFLSAPCTKLAVWGFVNSKSGTCVHSF